MNKKILYLMLFFLVLYSIPQATRDVFDNGNLIGFTTYYHYRMAENLLQGTEYDTLSFGGRPYTYPPGFHILLAMFMPIAKYLVPLFGALGILVCYLFAKEIDFSDKEALLAASLLGVIPGYVYLSSHINPRLPALVTLVGVFYLLMKNKVWQSFYASLMLTFVGIMHPLVGGIGFVFGGTMFRNKKIVTPLLIALLLFSIWFVPFISHFGWPHPAAFYGNYTELKRGLNYFIYETGTASDSIGLIMLIIAAYGFFRTKTKKENMVSLWFLLGILAALLLGNRLDEQILFPTALLTSLVLSRHAGEFLSSFNLSRFFNMRVWRTLFIVYIIALAAGMTISMTLSLPYSSDQAVLSWVSNNTPNDSVVLASWEVGHWVTEIGKRKNMIDAYAEYAPDIDERYADEKTMLYSSDINEVLATMKKYNITYVYYRTGKIDECSGFPFLTRTTGYFDKKAESTSRDGKTTSIIYKVDYTGHAPKDDLCTRLRK